MWMTAGSPLTQWGSEELIFHLKSILSTRIVSNELYIEVTTWAEDCGYASFSTKRANLGRIPVWAIIYAHIIIFTTGNIKIRFSLHRLPTYREVLLKFDEDVSNPSPRLWKWTSTRETIRFVSRVKIFCSRFSQTYERPIISGLPTSLTHRASSEPGLSGWAGWQKRAQHRLAHHSLSSQTSI